MLCQTHKPLWIPGHGYREYRRIACTAESLNNAIMLQNQSSLSSFFFFFFFFFFFLASLCCLWVTGLGLWREAFGGQNFSWCFGESFWCLFFRQCLVPVPVPYCPFDITRKDVFFLAFYFKWKYLFWMTISYQKPFVFSVCVFCSQICTLKLNLWPKIGMTYAISIVKWFFFFKFFIKKRVFKFLCRIRIIDVSQQYCENYRKIEHVELVGNLLPSNLPYRFLHNHCIHFYYGEKWKYLIFFFKNQWLE